MKKANEGALRACLLPLLDALGAGGGTEAALRSIEMEELRGLPDFLNALAALGFTHRQADLRLSSLDASNLPCLISEPDGDFLVALRRDGDSVFAFDGSSGRYRRFPALKGRARCFRFFQLVKEDGGPVVGDWFWTMAGRFRRYLAVGSVFSLALGALSLLYPVLMTAMYGRLTATSETRFVLSLALGAFLYLIADTGLRFLRGALLDYSSARFGQTIGAEIFRRLLSFKTAFTESAPLDSQIRRVRDFETIADFISGPAFASLFDLPFILLNIFWLASAGPRLLVAPLLALVFFAVAAAVLYPVVRKAQIRLSLRDGARHDLFAQILAAKSQLSGAAVRDSWIERFSTASRSASLAGYQLQSVNGLVSSLSSLVVSLGGLATLYFGILDVFAGNARPDALVAAMLLVWRVLEPARSAFIVVTQLDGVVKSIDQIKRFLTIPLELPNLSPKPSGKRPEGALSFQDVFFRYSAESYPALSGLSLSAKPGSILSISGHEGSGKTTIAKLSLGLYRAQSGMIALGGQNIHQIEPSLLRRSIAFAPAAAPIFPGSVMANLRLGAPDADDRFIIGIAETLGLVKELKSGGWTLESRFDARSLKTVPEEVGRLLTLVRAFARKASVIILDEPSAGIPAHAREPLAELLRRRRDGGDAVILISNDPSLLSTADSGLKLDGGRALSPNPAGANTKRRAS